MSYHLVINRYVSCFGLFYGVCVVKLKQIETPRLIIRPVALGDEYEINTAINNSLEVLQKWQVWAQDPSLKTTREFVQAGAFAWYTGIGNELPMVVVHKQDNKIIAATGFNDKSDFEKGLYEIGYWCDSYYQGKGYVTEYANALTRYAFEELEAFKVVIAMQIDNKKSIAVAKRLNFICAGTEARDPSEYVASLKPLSYLYTIAGVAALPVLKCSWSDSKSKARGGDVFNWVKMILNISDNQQFKGSKTIVQTPWSYVAEINIGCKRFYLKTTPKKLALESVVIEYLAKECKASVPKILAINEGLNSFLMQDSGVSLRSILKQNFAHDLVSRSCSQFAQLQITTSLDLSALMALGVPNWGLEQLPELFANLLNDIEFLKSDGLTSTDLSKLNSLVPKIKLLCDELASFAIPETMVQCDFHDNNILYEPSLDQLTVIDLGEVVISHPFFVLVGYMWQLMKHHGLQSNSEHYQIIKNAYLDEFLEFGTRGSLASAYNISNILWHVYSALAQFRLLKACTSDLMQLQCGKLSSTLRDIIQKLL